MQGQKRKLDPRKFSAVKSKVGKNVKVANKTSQSLLKQKFKELFEAQTSAHAVENLKSSNNGGLRSKPGSARKSPSKRSV